MDSRATLIEKIGQLSEHDVAILLEIALPMAGGTSQETKPECPYCRSSRTIRYGRKHGKQRFWCKARERTFVTTTHTVMSMSHYAEDIQREVITDTLQGYAIDHTARRLGLYHQADERCFYNLNTVNGFHSYIKRKYSFYRGVASKYLNRYNALFSIAYRDLRNKIGQLANALLSLTSHSNYYSIRTVRTEGVLAI